MNETIKAYLNRIREKEKQLDVLLQQQKQYKIKNKQRKVEYEKILGELEEELERQKLEHAELLRQLSEEWEHY